MTLRRTPGAEIRRAPIQIKRVMPALCRIARFVRDGKMDERPDGLSSISESLLEHQFADPEENSPA